MNPSPSNVTHRMESSAGFLDLKVSAILEKGVTSGGRLTVPNKGVYLLGILYPMFCFACVFLCFCVMFVFVVVCFVFCLCVCVCFIPCI